MPARSIHITGKVQNVCFRAAAQEKAKECGLCGWVRNTKQGGVEIYAEGDENALDALEQWCHSGPPAAKVERVTTKEAEQEGLSDFTIAY